MKKMDKQEKSMAQQFRELDEAMMNLGLSIAYALKLDKICNWVNRMLNKVMK